jgi:hypothetical protein
MDAALIEITFHHHEAIPILATTTGTHEGSKNIKLTFGAPRLRSQSSIFIP